MDSNEVLERLGGFGKYQLLVFLGFSYVYMRGSWQVLGILYMGAVPSFQCNVDPENHTEMYEVEECKLGYVDSGQNVTQSCLYGFTYGDEYEETIVSEWDLVCEKDYLVDLSTTIYMIGNSVGAIALTPLSDRYGRKWVLLICICAQTVIGVAVAFVHNYVLFTTLRCFVGFLNMAIALMTYVMVTELFPASHRARPPVVLGFFWSLGLILLAVFGYLVTNWRHLDLLITLPNLLVLGYFWWLPESIPWLVSKGKIEEVQEIVRKAAYLNNIRFPAELFDCPPQETAEVTNRIENLSSQHSTIETGVSDIAEGEKKVEESCFTVANLFRTPLMRRYSFIVFYLWFINSLGYFGILFSTPTLSGNVYLNLGISGAVEIPALVVCMVALDCVGRKKPLIVFLMLCGVMNISTLFIPQQTASGTDLTPLIIAFAMVGKFGITGSYSTIYLYSSEIFPTVIRNQAVGLSSFFENLGGIAAPFIVYGAKSLANLPLVLFGILTIIGGILALFLPETHKQALPETVEDVECRSKPKPVQDSLREETYL